MNEAAKKIRPRERDTIIQALTAGVVPRIGLPSIQVGRAPEIAALYATSTALQPAARQSGS